MGEVNNTFGKLADSGSTAAPWPYLKGSTYVGANQISIRVDLAVHCSRIKSLGMKPLEINLSLACKMLSPQANP